MEDEEVEVNGKFCSSIELTYQSSVHCCNFPAQGQAQTGGAGVGTDPSVGVEDLPEAGQNQIKSLSLSTVPAVWAVATCDAAKSLAEPTTASLTKDVSNNNLQPTDVHISVCDYDNVTTQETRVSSSQERTAAPATIDHPVTPIKSDAAKSDAAKSSNGLQLESQRSNIYYNQKAPVIKITFPSNPKQLLVFLSDIVRIDRHEKCHNKTSKAGKFCCCNKAKKCANHFFVVFFINRKAKNASKWCLKSVVIGFKNAQTLESYFSMFKNAFDKVCEAMKRPRNLFVIVNPFGGSGKGLKIWETKAKPVFFLAGLTLTTVLTKRAGHAYELCYDLPFELFDGIIAVGGDGILNECVHALASRREEGQFDRCPIPLGLIPAGSTNCINEVATGVVSVLSSCLQIITGQSLGLDVIFLRDKSDQLVRVAFCSVAYGFFGDVLIRSEKLRCIGPIRYILAGGLSFIHLRTYRVDTDISIADVQHCNPTESSTKCEMGCKICTKAKEMPPVMSKQNRKIEAEVAYVQVVANSCACKQSKLGISPNAHLGDGTMDMVFARKTACPHWNAVKMFFVHSSKADRFALNFIRVYRLADAEIRILPPVTKEEKKKLKEEKKRLKMEEARKRKNGLVSNSTSSSTLHSAMKQHLKGGSGTGEDMDTKSYVMSETSGCPPSPVHDSGASPTEHSESSRDEDDQNRAMLSLSPQQYRSLNSSEMYHTNQSMYSLHPGAESNQDLSDDPSEPKKTSVYVSGRRYGKYKIRNSKGHKRQLTTRTGGHANLKASFQSQNTAINSPSKSDERDEASIEPEMDSEPFEPKMWISVDNVNALWNIDGEICESNSLRLHPVCQFLQFFAARPMPESWTRSKHRAAMGSQVS